jgi:hypothetical protein
MKIRRAAFVAFAAGATLVLAACGGDDSGGDVAEVDAGDFPDGSTMARLAAEGSITIGTKFDQPLFGLRGPSGDPEGFDVEMGKLIAGKLGIAADDIEWRETQSAVREEFIEGSQVDIVIATYTINDDRKERIDFAGPYFNAQQMIMVRADENEINGVEDLAGKSACSVEGSTPAQNMRENYPDVSLELGPQRIHTSNHRLHRAEKMRRTRQIRTMALLLAKPLRAMEKARITAVICPRDHRSTDAHNAQPSVKAAIDGVVDAGVLPDDNNRHLLGLTFIAGQSTKAGVWRIDLHIEEVKS